MMITRTINNNNSDINVYNGWNDRVCVRVYFVSTRMILVDFSLTVHESQDVFHFKVEENIPIFILICAEM